MQINFNALLKQDRCGNKQKKIKKSLKLIDNQIINYIFAENFKDRRATKQVYKQQGNIGLFDKEETTNRLNKIRNPLDKLSKVIDFEMFREELETNLFKEKLSNF